MSGYPQRVVCLTTEIAFALGAGDRVVGVSGYSVRPPEARRKPKVGAYTTVNVGWDPAVFRCQGRVLLFTPARELWVMDARPVGKRLSRLCLRAPS